MSYGRQPFGLRELIVASQDGTTFTRLPLGMVMRFSERLASGELRAEERVAALASVSEAVDWELESGGISLLALGIMTGRTWVETGSTPNRTLTLTGQGGDRMPYIRVYGKALSAEGGDIHVKLWKAKVTSFEGSFRSDEFWVSSCAGVAIDDGSNGVFDAVQNETAAELGSGLGQLNFADDADLATLGCE